MKHPNTKVGRYEVVQPIANGTLDDMRFDFDAEAWSCEWLNLNGVEVLRMYEINLPEDAATFGYQDFSKPVSIKFVPEEQA
jgi:lipoate-protein ligase A